MRIVVGLLVAFCFLLLYTTEVCGDYFTAGVLLKDNVDSYGSKYIYTTGEQGKRWQMQALLQSNLAADDPEVTEQDETPQDNPDTVPKDGTDGPVKPNDSGTSDGPSVGQTDDKRPADSGSHDPVLNSSASAPVPSAVPAPGNDSPKDSGAPSKGLEKTQAAVSSSSSSHDSSQNLKLDVDPEDKSALFEDGGNVPPSKTDSADLKDLKGTDVPSTDDVQSSSTTSKNTESVTESTENNVLAHFPLMLFLFFLL